MMSPVDLQRQTLTILAGDLVKGYEALMNAAGGVMAQAATARATLVLAGATPDETVHKSFANAMDALDKAVGQLAAVSREVLSVQNRLVAGAGALVVPKS